MAGTSFKMDLGQLMGGVAGAINKMGDTQSLMEAVGETLVSGAVERFETGQGPDGQAWKPSLRAQAEGGQTLVDKARLKSSIGYEASRTQVMVGTNVEYAAIHQFGGQAGRGRAITLPARPFIGLSEADRSEVQGLMRDFLAGAFRP